MRLISSDQQLVNDFTTSQLPRWEKHVQNYLPDSELKKLTDTYTELNAKSYVPLKYKQLYYNQRTNSPEFKISENIFEQPVTDKHQDIDKLMIFRFGWVDNYGHLLHDYLPMLLYVDTHCTADVIVSVCTPNIKSLISTLGITLKKTVFLHPGDQIEYRVRSINVFDNKVYRVPRLTQSFKCMVDKHIDNTYLTSKFNLLIYCTRNTSTDVRHGRLMDQQNEDEIVSLLEQYTKTKNMGLVIFNGQVNGKTMGHVEQLKLFREAKIVVGPHGSAMVNILYLNPVNKPVVCEFTSGQNNIIHGGGNYSKNYNSLFAHCFETIYDYCLIPFDLKSTEKVTSVDIEDVKQFLQII